MPSAHWNGATLAETEDYEEVEGNIYFPPEALHRQHFQESDHHTVCGWKGTASYYHVVVDGQVNENAAWTYPSPKPAAANIADYVAFWHGVEVRRDP